jgi:hypothetical protein
MINQFPGLLPPEEHSGCRGFRRQGHHEGPEPAVKMQAKGTGGHGAQY